MKDKIKIYIIGAGAIGKALAVFLKLENKNVVIIRGSIDNEPIYKNQISVKYNKTQSLKAEVEIATLSHFSTIDGLVILTNKSYGNGELAKKLKGKIGNSPIVLLQNGLGIEQVFIDSNFPEIYRCVLFATSQISPDNELSFTPVAICPIGIIKGNDESLTKIADSLNTSYFQFRVENNIQPIIWKKAIANIVFNSICSLLEIDNGIFHRGGKTLEIAQRVITECILVANKMGILLNYDDVMESVLLISKLSEGQIISTLQDIRNNRETEIETLNFAIVNFAKSINLEHSVTETQLLGELTLLKSELNR